MPAQDLHMLEAANTLAHMAGLHWTTPQRLLNRQLSFTPTYTPEQAPWLRPTRRELEEVAANLARDREITTQQSLDIIDLTQEPEIFVIDLTEEEDFVIVANAN